jgi:hypothetical protein
MTSNHVHRWRELRAWFDDFPPDDQERLLGYVERLILLAKDRDMGAFLDWVDTLFVLIELLLGDFRVFSSFAGLGELAAGFGREWHRKPRRQHLEANLRRLPIHLTSFQTISGASLPMEK